LYNFNNTDQKTAFFRGFQGLQKIQTIEKNIALHGKKSPFYMKKEKYSHQEPIADHEK